MSEPSFDYVEKRKGVPRKPEGREIQDAIDYFWHCNLSGTAPADQELFELGGEWAGHEGRVQAENTKRAERAESYGQRNDFLEEAEELNPGDIGANPGEKTELLKKYFRRFREGESQDIEAKGYTDPQIGALFGRMVIFYRNRNK